MMAEVPEIKLDRTPQSAAEHQEVLMMQRLLLVHLVGAWRMSAVTSCRLLVQSGCSYSSSKLPSTRSRRQILML
jgi:hypothetical protein